jgi:hypothetical protein
MEEAYIELADPGMKFAALLHFGNAPSLPSITLSNAHVMHCLLLFLLFLRASAVSSIVST